MKSIKFAWARVVRHIQKSGTKIQYAGNSAEYYPSENTIQIPKRYVETPMGLVRLLHEAGHAEQTICPYKITNRSYTAMRQAILWYETDAWNRGWRIACSLKVEAHIAHIYYQDQYQALDSYSKFLYKSATNRMVSNIYFNYKTLINKWVTA